MSLPEALANRRPLQQRKSANQHRRPVGYVPCCPLKSKAPPEMEGEKKGQWDSVGTDVDLQRKVKEGGWGGPRPLRQSPSPAMHCFGRRPGTRGPAPAPDMGCSGKTCPPRARRRAAECRRRCPAAGATGSARPCPRRRQCASEGPVQGGGGEAVGGRCGQGGIATPSAPGYPTHLRGGGSSPNPHSVPTRGPRGGDRPPGKSLRQEVE